jgi:hypothetical protein
MIVIDDARCTPNLSARSIFLALARDVPDPLHPDVLVKNPNITWNQVDSTLPDEHIKQQSLRQQVLKLTDLNTSFRDGLGRKLGRVYTSIRL